MKVLNVGGGARTTLLPRHYDGWTQVWLDVDDSHEPDILLDARRLTDVEPGTYSAVYCSHNLEHYFEHDVPKVLAGFRHVLAEDGVAEIIVPDILHLVKDMLARSADIDDVAYESGVGPITYKDVIYGYGKEIEESGQDFYAHKTGFTAISLDIALRQAGFAHVQVRDGQFFEAHAFASMSAARLEETSTWRRFYD